jgi:chloramphenicol O-acetyltransferase type A
MATREKLDLSTWARKEHFDFFNTFEEPYHGVCVSIDCTAAYRFVKSAGVSFFLYYLYQSLAAAQTIPAFRYRIEGDEVFLYDTIDAGSAIDRADGTFGYGLLPYRESFDEFLAVANLEVARVRSVTGLTRTTTNNLIRYSVLPWTDFTSLSHARAFSKPDSCPRITFGKATQHDDRRKMPISIHVHHALVDGREVGQYLKAFQNLMNSH